MSGLFRAGVAVLAATFGLGVLAAPASAEPVPTTGCGQAVANPGTTTVEHLTSGGIDREYRIYVPARYHPHRQYPVVLSYHGHGRTAEYQEELSGFSGSDVIAVYPQGVAGTDGKSAWTGAPYSAPVDDVQFTGDLLTSVQHRMCVDPTRIYAAGKSNGGGFVGVLACRMADRIAAFAPVSGAFYPQGGACDPGRKVALLDFHGTADTTIPYSGNPAKGLPSIPDWLNGWAARDRCFPYPVSVSPVPHVVKQWWPGCSLVHFRVEGAGHVWPSTRPNNDSDTPTTIDATPVILQFFKAHHL
ncbi:polyhydroxybutyrate depolymerase [Amycolatopsis echigonensis]|uniref:Polyhydroxybutyrate depolymerase n=1 Tax=Amycolatopsis echigonensis TaxID=2576905 RepID=A0A2N3WK88_9PSEU|nr:ferulic acid esterase [Amycolatopsis niigatensis]PKV94265.1 polyhydroxybutyrate depolymerase [Amycolatopsis niigatensis]